MAPIPTIGRPGDSGINHGPQNKSRSVRAQEERRSELVCRVKYSNTLPDIPFDPKFLACPFDHTRFISYNPTSLERKYKYELLTEHDLGISVDLILPDAYSGGSESDVLDPKDERLLEDEHINTGDVNRSKRHSLMLSWMRKPDYISTEQTRYQPTTIEKVESKVGYAVRKKMGTQHPHTYLDRDAQLKAIGKTFEDSKLPIEEHHADKSLYPVEVLPVLPDSEMWKFPCAQVIFDSDPAPMGLALKDQLEMMSQAMIRGVMDESGEQFVAYFLPTDDTRDKRKMDEQEGREYDDEAEYEYKMSREYNWNVKSKSSKGYEENYFFVKRDDGLYYNELETRVRLSKRRLRAGQQPSNSKLVVRHRPLNKQEHKMQRYRERHLEPHAEEDEDLSDDDDEEEDGEEKEGAEDGDDDNRSRSRSKSRSRSASKSASRSRSSSPNGSISRSASGSRSASPASNRTRSPSKSRSVSKSPSKSRSRSRSGSRSSSARSQSKSGSRSGSPSGSE